MNLGNTSSGVVILISCIICSIITAVSGLCPESTQGTCTTVAGILNCMLCLSAILHLFGVFKT